MGRAVDAVGAAGDAASPAPRITVTVVYSPCAGTVDQVVLSLPAGATVADAVRASGLPQRHAALDPAHTPVGVWGALRCPQDLLREADRVELYRPLSVDPKEARRRRHRIQSEALSGERRAARTAADIKRAR